MDLGIPTDRRRPRAWQAGPASDDSDTTDFDGSSEDLSTSSFLAKDPVTPAPAPAAAVDAPQKEHESEAAAPAPLEIGPGSLLRHRYLIEKRIGEGGTSEVFSAIDRHRGNGADGYNRLAIKLLHSKFRNDEPRTERLIREFRHMQRLTHPGIARVYDLDCENGLWFITMELLEGRPLHQRIRLGLKAGEALPILTLCAEALAYAHDHAVVHGDLKPSNIFILRDGSVRLLDFGSVPSPNEVSTRTPGHRQFAATPPYASPELLDGQEAGPRDDVFSLGCLAYELFSGGQHPFNRRSSLDARQQQMRPAYHASMQPRHFAVIARALSWDRAARPANARDFLSDFLASHFVHEPAPHAGPLTEPQDSPETSDRKEPPVMAKPATETRDVAPSEPVTAAKPAANPRSEPILSYEEARARFAEPIPAELLVSTLRYAAAEPSLPSVQELEVEGFSRSRFFWLRPALLAALFILTVIAGAFFWQQLTVRDVKLQPAAQQRPTTGVSPLAPAVATTPSPAASKPLPVPVEQPAPPPKQKQVSRTAGTVTFESAAVRVSASQSVAAVNVRRTEAKAGSAQIVWSTVAGSAKPNVDYESVDSQVVRFHEGQDVRSLYIPIKQPPGPAQERRFSVRLEKTARGPALGALSETEIIISGTPVEASARQL